MSKAKIGDARRLPFFMVTKGATAAIRERFDSRRGQTVLAVYVAILECANDERSDHFEKPRREIAERGMVTVKTLDTCVGELESLGLLHVERVTKGAWHRPNLWTLTDPCTVGGGVTDDPTPDPEVAKLTTPPPVGGGLTEHPRGGVTDDPYRARVTRPFKTTTKDEQPQEGAQAPLPPSRELDLLRWHADLWGATNISDSRWGTKQIQSATWLLANVKDRDLVAVLKWAKSHRFWSGRGANINRVRSEWSALKAQYDAESRSGRGGADARIRDLEIMKQEARQRERTQPEMRI
jgi:hypothetical protein